MSIQKREDGRKKPYLVRLRDPGGREHSKAFTKKDEARAWEAEQRVLLAEGRSIDPRGGQTRLSDHAEVYLRSPAFTNLSVSSQSQRESLLRCHVLPRFGSWPLRSLTLPHVETWAADLVGAGKAPSTVHQALSVLRWVCADAVRRGLIPTNPAEGVHVRDRSPLVDHRYLSASEVESLADAIDPRYRVVVLLGALAGLRIGEVAAVSPSKITGGVVTIDSHVVEVKGRTSLEAGTKSRAVPKRKLAVGDRLVSEIETHLRLYGTTRQGMLVGSHDGTNLLSRSWFGLRRFRPAVARSVGDPMRVHDLRHTNVALQIAAGTPIEKISKRLGHASIRVTADVYGHLLEDADRAAADALDTYLAQNAGAMRAGILRAVPD